MDNLQLCYAGSLVLVIVIAWFWWEDITGRPRPKFRKKP
jgi:hypothetical protein